MEMAIPKETTTMPSETAGVIGLVGDIMIETPTVRARRNEVAGFDAATRRLDGFRG